jgi:16S rRNA (cytidine1402-2'-O)-methyltransferase
MALLIVATPLGTLSDLSPRAKEVLGGVGCIAAEDTRTTRALLTASGVPAPELVALHAHNEDEVARRLAERARLADVALVSDAGTPGVSDPGRRLVEVCHEQGVEVRSVPGPSALTSALAASGFPAAPSTFLGFPPRKGREGWCREVLGRGETLVIFEAPTRVAGLVEELAALQPEREAAMCRELSKRFEEVRRAPLAALAVELGGREQIRGECVVVVGPGEPLVPDALTVEDGASLKQVAQVLAARWGVSRKEAYDRLLALERDLG